LATAGVLMPDPKLEDYLRDLAGLPPAEHDGQESYGAPAMPGAEGGTAPENFDAPPSLEEELDIPEGQEPLDGDLE
jgi:hypothetical protein